MTFSLPRAAGARKPVVVRRRGRAVAAAALALALAACSLTPDEIAPGTVEPGEAAPSGPSLTPRLPALPPGTALRNGKALPHFSPASWANLPAFEAEDYTVLWQAFLRNCQAVLERGLSPQNRATVVAAGPWRDTCVAAFEVEANVGAQTDGKPVAGVSASAGASGAGAASVGAAMAAVAPGAAGAGGAPADAITGQAARSAVIDFLKTRLQPWLVTEGGKPASNMVTGYYEPLVRASRRRGGEYQWPLYSVPDDMLVIDLGSLYPELAGKRVRGKLDGRRVVPYDTRAELGRDGREPKALVWVDDPVDAFFLQVQGSGRAQLDNGKVIRLAYADQNGHPYASIGRWLVDKRELTLDQASMQNIREWARRNPDRVPEMLNANPSVVFFQEEPVHFAGEGPRGAFNVPLTAGHSIAVDPQFVPLGSPIVLATSMPGSKQPLNRLVFAQDTGSAIKGAARADFYWGFGDEAGAMAGRMKQDGKMWVLWPKGAGAPSADR